MRHLFRAMVLGVASLLALLSTPVQATFIDFETDTFGNPTVSGTPVAGTYSSLGATFVGADFFTCGGGCPTPIFGHFISSSANDFFSPVTIMFSSVASFVSMVNVSNSAFTLSAFDVNNVLLGSVSVSSFLQVASISTAGISYVVVSTSFQYGFDDLTFFLAQQPVPEPATIALLLLGVFGTVGLRVRHA